jgi:hypothetical protein
MFSRHLIRRCRPVTSAAETHTESYQPLQVEVDRMYHHFMARFQVANGGDGLQKRMVAVNVLNKN